MYIIHKDAEAIFMLQRGWRASSSTNNASWATTIMRGISNRKKRFAEHGRVVVIQVVVSICIAMVMMACVICWNEPFFGRVVIVVTHLHDRGLEHWGDWEDVAVIVSVAVVVCCNELFVNVFVAAILAVTVIHLIRRGTGHLSDVVVVVIPVVFLIYRNGFVI